MDARTSKGTRIMKQTSKQHLRFALEMLVFTIFPIMETAKTPIVLGQIYVLFFLCVEVIGWMYVKSLRENAQNAKLLILLGFGALTIGYGAIVRSLLILIGSLIYMLVLTLCKKWI